MEPCILSRSKYDAVIFDLDGVVTKTAEVHAQSWKVMFDEFLHRHSGAGVGSHVPFDADAEYRRYVDGKPRYEGVKSFLVSRNIDIPYGDPGDPPDRETVCGLGNRKNEVFKRLLRERGVEVYESTIELIRKLKHKGFKIAIVTSSKNCVEVLEAAGIADMFDMEKKVDGRDAERLGLKGKPNPDVFVKAAELLVVDRSRAVVVEDAVSGVQAGRDGGFACVIGVDRTGHPESLEEAGASVVVSDLEEVTLIDS